MNLQRGFNRIFILLSLVVSLYGFISGREYAVKSWKPDPKVAFHFISWNEENIRKYYEYAKTVAEERVRITEERAKIERKINTNKLDIYGQEDARISLLGLEISLANLPDIKIEDLQNFGKSTPQYNERIFQETFPEALKTHAYKTWIGGTMGILVAFFLCYGGLYLIQFIVKWIINKFMVLEVLKSLYRAYFMLVHMILKALVFCVGIGLMVGSYHPASRGSTGAWLEPFQFALGLAICIVSGVVLLKAIQNYLK